MPKKLLVSLVVAVVGLGVAGYWFAAQQASDRVAMATLPPAQALGFFAMPGLPQAWTDVRASKFYQHVSTPVFWQRALGADGYARLTAEIRRLEDHLGWPLTESTMHQVLEREFGLALVPSQNRVIDVIAYARVSRAEKLAEALSRTFSRTPPEATRQTHTVDGVEIVTLHFKDVPTSISYALLGTLAVISTDQFWIIDAIKAHQGTASDRLYTNPVVKALPREAGESLFTYGYIDMEGLQTTMRAELPWVSGAASPTPLYTTRKVTLIARRAPAGVMVDTMAWSPPHGKSAVFRQVERDGATPPFRGVPAETFYLTHVDLLNLQGLWQLLTQRAAMGYQDRLQEMLSRFRAWAGVDLEGDVLPLFTGVVGLGFTAPFGAQRGGPISLPGMFLTLGITDESQAQQLIQIIGKHVGGPLFTELLQRRLHDGHSIYYLNNPLLFASPGYVISRQQLILGSDLSLLKHMLDAASGKTTPLTDTPAYQEVRKHFRSTGESLTFVDFNAAIQEARAMWGPLSLLLRAFTPIEPGTPVVGTMPGDMEALLELLRPIRYLGVASQAEPQGVRTEAFVAIKDLH